PDALRDTATAEALQAIIDLDLSDLVDIEPPRGYGRDWTETKWGIFIRHFWGEFRFSRTSRAVCRRVRGRNALI
ncbi:MAG: hypothetical protein M3Y22_05540, partial [Pseudomonadota bacterium]|nr:hypothetical protein [Pseudomonadota bacterium]